MMIVRQHIALGETDYYGSRIFSMKILCLVVRDGESHRSEARPFVILMITFVTLDYKWLPRDVWSVLQFHGMEGRVLPNTF